MNSESEEVLQRVEYWNDRYTTEKDDAVAHEWFRSFEHLKGFLETSLPAPESNARILHLGCGLSTLPADLYHLGYKWQTGIDFSPVAVESMKEKHKSLDSLQWQTMDVRKMAFEDGSFDVAIDKGTLDAMLHGSLWDPEPDVKENVKAYVDEVARILQPGGEWLYVTFRQPHFLRPLLQRPGIWEPQLRTLQDGPGSFEYFAWTMVKATT